MYNWVNSNDLLCQPHGLFVSDRLAGFDFDDTLIVSDSLKKVKDKQWTIKKNVKEVLKILVLSRYTIVIFSNQAGLKDTNSQLEWIRKMSVFQNEIGFNIRVIASLKKDYCRKPHTGMFTINSKINGLKFDLTKSFYCGDAGGRKKDFANSDRCFAYNCGLIYFTPEQMFETPSLFNTLHLITDNFSDVHPEDKNCVDKIIDDIYITNSNFAYQDIIKNINDKYNYNKQKLIYDTHINPEEFLKKNVYSKIAEKKMIIMIGAPASGKSFLSARIAKLYGYKIINRDTLGTKCVNETKKCLEKGEKVIIDNTNPDEKSRAVYEELCDSVAYIYMDVSKEMVQHLNNVRVEKKGTEIPKVVYNVFYKKLVLPKNVIKVPFLPIDCGEEFYFKFN